MDLEDSYMMNIGSMTTIGLLIVLTGFFSYLILLFVIHRFTYRTWIFDVIIGLGIAAALVGWIFGGNAVVTLITVVLGVAWFPVIRHELKLTGSKHLKLRVGDRLPQLSLLTTDSRQVTEEDLIASAPTLLVLYRGWWCPSSKSQLDEIARDYESFSGAGITIFAASVDQPAEAAPLQLYVGDKITILCNVPKSLLDEVGVRDQRGAPWYDRILFGAKRQDIAMPSALVINASGKIVFVYRSTRVDDRARPADIIASL
jgi:peroxiredoxin